MEIIVVSIIIFALCMILGVSLNYILLAVFAIFCLFSSFLSLFFLYSVICLLLSKRKEARFIRFDKLRNSKYQAAYYLVDGVEYSCVFPREGIMKDKLYQQNKIYHVMLNKKMEKVFDRFAISTCVLGLVFSIGLSIVLVCCLV